MPANFITIVGVVAVASLIGCGSATTPPPRLADPPATALIAQYPANAALKATLETHAEGGSGRPRDNLLMTTWFVSPDARVGNWSTVDTAGRLAMYRFTYDWGFGATEQAQLTENQFPDLRKVLRTLPQTDAAHLPPVEQLLLISFRRADLEWVTRAYDRRNLPADVAHLFEVTGAPLEPADHR